MNSVKHFQLVTSTASLCILDPSRIRHRLNDPPDWWSDFVVEFEEVNLGNAMIVGLGSDGRYMINVGNDTNASARSVSALICNESGRVFVGPGEEITGGGFEPSTLRNRTGIFLDLEPATYRVTVTRHAASELSIGFTRVDAAASNVIEDQLLLED